MKPDVSHDFVKDFMVKAAEHNCTVASTSLSRPLKIWPKIDLSSAFCSHRITPITMANCTRGNLTMRAGPGCLNKNSASISGASAGVRPPRGAEEDRSRLDPGCGRQGSNAVVARCKSRDIEQSSFAPHRRFRRLADRPPRI